MKLKPNQAWHFIRRDENGIDRLRDGTEAPKDGVWLEYRGPLKMCESGLHFSRHPFDALAYAPGEILCLVEVGGEVIEGEDKGVCSRRKIIARKDATEGIRYFARMQALSVIHLYPGEPEDCVLNWLVGGDHAARAAAEAAARAAAWSAADSAAWSARAAAEAAARAAAWSAAEAAARAAARSAEAAARAAARSARAAAWSARAAAWSAADSAAWSARAAAWSAADSAAWSARAAAEAAAEAAARQQWADLVAEAFE